MKRLKKNQGLSLIEVMIALTIFLIALLALAQGLIAAVVLNTKNRDLMKVSAMCKDKAEQLVCLGFDDVTTNTAVDPSGDPLIFPTGGAGKGLGIGGSVTPNPPMSGYVDYLDTSGKRVTPAQSRFCRQWMISQTGNIKIIRVTVVGAPGTSAYQSASAVTYKSK
jgi:prepilin-type N-terminal cleavage/methylation domain-containing protein